MKYKIGQKVTIIGLMPFQKEFQELLQKVGTIIYIDVYKAYPLFIFIDNKVIAVQYDCIKIENCINNLG